MMTISSELDQVRLEIGDTDMTAPLFTDDEIQYFLSQTDNILLASANACDALATRFAAGIDFTTDTLAVKKLQRSDIMAKRADSLRLRAMGGIVEIDQAKVDGYSQDIDNTDTELIQSAPVDPDIPRYGPSWERDLERQIGYKSDI
jgi:hypothetical protein